MPLFGVRNHLRVPILGCRAPVLSQHPVCCEVSIWSKFGGFRSYSLAQVGVIIWSKFVFSLFSSGFKRFLHTQLSFCVCFCAQLSGDCLKIGDSLFLKNVSLLRLLKHYKDWGFSNFCVFAFKEKKKGKKWHLEFLDLGSLGPKIAVSRRMCFV